MFDQNESVINDALKVLNSESVSPVEKLKASETILGFTVSVNRFRIDNNNTGKFIDMKYNKLPIIECIYDSECGIRFDKKKKIRGLSIAYFNLVSNACCQLGLFDDEKKEDERIFDRALDQIKARFGSNAILRSSSLLKME